MKYKIAYYEEKDCHTEIFGMFLYNLKDSNFTLYNDKDKSDYVSYFKKFTNYETKPTDKFLEEYKSFDLIIIGTSSDTKKIKHILNEYEIKNKTYLIVHLKEELDSLDYNDNIIALTPLNINLKYKRSKYILPIHNYYTETITKKENILSIVGRFKNGNRDINGLVSLIKNHNDKNFRVHLFSRHQKFVPKEIFELNKEYPNKIKIFLGLDGKELEKRLVKSKYLLPLAKIDDIYHQDRMSGSIPLAFNYNVPLIIDKKLNDIYDFTSTITYENKLEELIDIINDDNEIKYQKILFDFIEEKNQILSDNKNKFSICFSMR